MKLTSEMLKNLVESELKKAKKAKKTKNSKPQHAKAKEIDADDFANSLANKVNHYKDVKESIEIEYFEALGMEEKRLKNRLAKISEQRQRIIKKILSAN